jgi:mRNA interferase RelE/StbE
VNAQFKSSFLKDLEAIRERKIFKQIRAAIDHIEQAQSLREIPNMKKLSGSGNYYRMRVGDFRLGLKIVGDTVSFIRCLDRKEIYRYLPW